jgi:hypothetical protein
MKPAIIFGLIVAVVFAALVLFAVEPPPLIGTWEGRVELGSGTPDRITIVFTQEGEILSATCADELGVAPEGTVLEEIKLEAGSLTFHLTTSDQDLINIFLTVSGDSMTGHWEDPAAGTSGAVELTRNK